MTDYSSWTDEQVNEAIAVRKGFSLCSGCGNWINFDGDEYKSCPDYTHDWRLCGELLEEMKEADVSLTYSTTLKKWGIEWMDNEMVSHEAFVRTTQRAICEAWLALKEQR